MKMQKKSKKQETGPKNKTLTEQVNQPAETNTKEVYDLTIKISRIEDKMKILDGDTKKLKKMEKDKLAKIAEKREEIEKDIESTLKGLNAKKTKILEIQKPKITKFKAEIQKMVEEYEELENEAEKIELENGHDTLKRNELKTEGDKTKNEYDNLKEKSKNLKEAAQKILQQMNDMNASAPQDYKYIQENMQFIRQIKELEEKNKNISNLINEFKQQNSVQEADKNQNNSLLMKVKNELKDIDIQINSLVNNKSVTALENNLKKGNQFIWNYIKEIMEQYYSTKNYNKDNFIEILRENWTNRINSIFNDEFISSKRQKESKAEVIQNRLTELNNQNKKDTDEYKNLEKELNELSKNLNTEETNFNSVYNLYNDVTLLLNQCQGKKDLDTDLLFKNLFEENIRKINPELESMSELQHKNYETVMALYLTELIKYSTKKKGLELRKDEIENIIKIKGNEVENEEEAIKVNNSKIKAMTAEKQKNLALINEINKTIDIKTTEMKKILSEQSEEQYKAYLNENNDTIKNFNKIYGKKILTKANKLQKEKIYEDRVKEHLNFKKSYEDCIEFIDKYEVENKNLNEKIQEVAKQYKILMDQVDDMDGGLGKEELNKNVKTRKELKMAIDKYTNEQSDKLKIQKESLEKKENIEYYVQKLKKLNNEIAKLNKRSDKIIEDFSIYYKQVEEEMMELQEKLLQFKEQLDEILYGEIRRKEREAKELEEKKLKEEEVRKQKEEQERYEEELKKEAEIKRKEERNRLDITEEEDIFANTNKIINAKLEIPKLDTYEEKVKTLLTGQIVYQRYSNKSIKTGYQEYNPVKNKGLLPEAFDYAKRKMVANLRLNRFDFYTVETRDIPRLEASLDFSEIHGIRYSDIAKKMIKSKQQNLLTGVISDFIARDDIPFSITTKDSNWDIVCPEYKSYVSIKTMIDSILKKENIMSKLPESYSYLLDDPDEDEEEKCLYKRKDLHTREINLETY